MFFSKDLKYSLKAVCDVVNITDDVVQVVNESGSKNGLANVTVTGSTTGITILEYEPNLVKDFCELMERLVPEKRVYHHDATWGDANGFSHLRSALIGTSKTLPVRNGTLVLGTWQQIVLANFDARPRTRNVSVHVVGSDRPVV